MSTNFGFGFKLPERGSLEQQQKQQQQGQLPWGMNFNPTSSSSSGGYTLPTSIPMSSPGELPPEKSSSMAVGEPEPAPKPAPKKKTPAKKPANEEVEEVVKDNEPEAVHDQVVEQREEARDKGAVEDMVKATTPEAPVDNLDAELKALDPEPFVKEQVMKDPKMGRWTAYQQNKMKLLGTSIPIPGLDLPGSRAHKALIENVNAERGYNQTQVQMARLAQQQNAGNLSDSRVKAKKLGVASSAYEKTIKEYSDGLYRQDGTNGIKTLRERLAKIKSAALQSGLVDPMEADYMFRDPPPYIIAKGQNSAAYLKLVDDKQFLDGLQKTVNDIYSKGRVDGADQAQLDSSINKLIGILGGDATNTADAERVRRQYLMLRPEKAKLVQKVIEDYFKAQLDVANATGQSQWSVNLKNKIGEIQSQIDRMKSGNPIDAVSAIGALFALGISSQSGLPMDPGNIKANANKEMMNRFMENVMMSADVDFEAVEKLIEAAYGKTVNSMNARNEAIGSGWREQNNYELRDRLGITVEGPGKSLVDVRPDFANGNWAKIVDLKGVDLSADEPTSRDQKKPPKIKGAK